MGLVRIGLPVSAAGSAITRKEGVESVVTHKRSALIVGF